MGLLNAMAAIDRLVSRIGQWAGLLILPLILVIMYDVVSRKFQFIQQWVLNSPLYDWISPTKLQELEWHLHAALFLLAFGYGYLRNSHVRVDLLREALAPRKQAMIELVGLILLALPFFSVFFYYGILFVEKSYSQGEGSSALTGIPHRWVIKSVLVVGTALLLMAIVATAVRLSIYLFGPTDLSERALKSLACVKADPYSAKDTDCD